MPLSVSLAPARAPGGPHPEGNWRLVRVETRIGAPRTTCSTVIPVGR